MRAWRLARPAHQPRPRSASRPGRRIRPSGDRLDPAERAGRGRSGGARAASLSHPGDRSAALDLLAADALITLALLAQAEDAPGAAGRVRHLRASDRPAGRVIDLHSHLLPGVDDGSRSVEQSVEVLLRDGAAGRHRRLPHAPPPVSAGRSGPPSAHDRAFEALRAEAPQMPRLHRGAEVMLDRPLTRPAALARNITLGGTRYILVEFPRLVAV